MKQRTLPMDSLPENEQGVVYLFADYARHNRLKVSRIQASYPDAVVRRRDATGEKSFRIEFEFRASNFRLHRHDPKKVDWIVCWENDWPDAPVGKVIALNQYYGYARNVWIGNPVTGRFDASSFERRVVSEYPVDHRAKAGDVVLVCYLFGVGECKYLGLPKEEACVTRLVAVARIDEVLQRERHHSRARLRRLVRFANPIRWDDVLNHASIGQVTESLKITHHWAEVLRRLEALSPESGPRLQTLM